MLLKQGMSGPDVQNLELVLQGLGFQGFDAADGNFDQKTENVIRYIQKANGLQVDGKVGPETLALIDRLWEPEVANFAPKAEILVPSVGGVIPAGDEELEHTNHMLTHKVLQIIELAQQEGYHLTVVQGLRTFAEQDRLFAQRPRVTKARGGQSYHNYGVAADLAFVVNGKLSWDDHLYRNIGRWASRVGLEWGGNWHFVDYPHVQLHSMPGTGKLKAVYEKAGGGQKGIEAVWNTYV
jgi:hypothetical protein